MIIAPVVAWVDFPLLRCPHLSFPSHGGARTGTARHPLSPPVSFPSSLLHYAQIPLYSASLSSLQLLSELGLFQLQMIEN